MTSHVQGLDRSKGQYGRAAHVLLGRSWVYDKENVVSGDECDRT